VAYSFSSLVVLYDPSTSIKIHITMIGRLSGILLEKNPPQLIVDCNGVGYEVGVPMSTFYNLPGLGEKVVLLTHLTVREDAHLLYGFGTAEERNVFKQLIKISGVGARTALSILSGMSVADLAHAVTLQEAGRLTKVPGIGKIGSDFIAGSAIRNDATSDILNALVALGYSDKEASLALKQVPPGANVSDGIKLALKALSKG
jgi:Holliday junction DNA helicase RuvA